MDSSFPFINDYYSMAYMYLSLFNHLPIEGYIGCFQFGPVMGKITINSPMQVFVWIHCCFARKMPKYAIAGLYGITCLIFKAKPLSYFSE